MQITIVNNAVNIEKFQGLIKDSKKIVNMKNVLKNCMDIRPGLAVKNPTQKNPPKKNHLKKPTKSGFLWVSYSLFCFPDK